MTDDLHSPSTPPDTPLAPGNQPDHEWALKRPFSWKLILVLLLATLLLGVSARRTDLDQGVGMTLQGVAYWLGLTDEAEISGGWKVLQQAFPLVVEERKETWRIEDFDRENLPRFSYVVTEPTREFDAMQGEWVEQGEKEFLVQPVGYLMYVLRKMLETLEMAMWGTILAVILALPLAYFGAQGYTWNPATYAIARGICSYCRALPELIIAIFFVLMYGFGTIPGVLALGLHCCGFLGKFFADDIENADRGPQDALRSTGANRLKVLWYAVLPQATPQFIAYIQYILERNVRTATVLGIVGAGGIGAELMGRLDQFDYGHVSTILLVVFLTVFALEQITQRIRGKLIG